MKKLYCTLSSLALSLLLTLHISAQEVIPPPITCSDCISSFAPLQDTVYMISVWTKENNAPPSKTSYTEPQVYIDFLNTATVTVASVGPFTPKGQIIDGWQRVEEQFTVSNLGNVKFMKVRLVSGVNADCFFDDIRIYPFKGSMKSYVYDPVTLRFIAELDERNYATIYEYDEEGKLTRVKKETEKGIMTIKESKTSSPKHN